MGAAYFVLAGPVPDDVVHRYRQLTGGARTPPQWAFGYVQSKERYHNQEVFHSEGATVLRPLAFDQLIAQRDEFIRRHARGEPPNTAPDPAAAHHLTEHN